MGNLNEKIYSKVMEIAETTATQAEQLNNINNHLEGINGKVHDHCGRIKILESVKTHISGVKTGVFFVVWVLWTVGVTLCIKFF